MPPAPYPEMLNLSRYKLFSSIPDQWHFGTDQDADPDPPIRFFDWRIQIFSNFEDAKKCIFIVFFNVLINEI
jgi:hypothetical protein